MGASEEIYMDSYSGGLILIPSGASTTSLTFYVSSDYGKTWNQVFNASAAAVSRTVAATRACAIPDECFAATRLKIVGNAATTAGILLKG